jgi:hypothetical protein
MMEFFDRRDVQVTEVTDAEGFFINNVLTVIIVPTV